MRRPFPRNPQMLLVPPGFGASLLRNALRSYQKSIYFDPTLPEEAAMMDTLNDLVNAADKLRD